MLTVRPARIEDATAMRELQQLAFAEEGRRSKTREIPPLQEDLNSIVDHVQAHVALVAVQQEALVGSVRGVKGDHGYVIRALIVHPARQGQGIGSTLLKALEAALPKPTRVDLTTNTLMQDNVPFYEKHGYRVQDRTEPIPGIVLAHMSKHLASEA
jgi:ribosomal protein S18 acetylase RimI-like enzyme